MHPSPQTLVDMINTELAQRMWKPDECVMMDRVDEQGNITQVLTHQPTGAKVSEVLYGPDRMMKQIVYPKLWLN